MQNLRKNFLARVNLTFWWVTKNLFWTTQICKEQRALKIKPLSYLIFLMICRQYLSTHTVANTRLSEKLACCFSFRCAFPSVFWYRVDDGLILVVTENRRNMKRKEQSSGCWGYSCCLCVKKNRAAKAVLFLRCVCVLFVYARAEQRTLNYFWLLLRKREQSSDTTYCSLGIDCCCCLCSCSRSFSSGIRCGNSVRDYGMMTTVKSLLFAGRTVNRLGTRFFCLWCWYGWWCWW